jgi:hypothetical protein
MLPLLWENSYSGFLERDFHDVYVDMISRPALSAGVKIVVGLFFLIGAPGVWRWVRRGLLPAPDTGEDGATPFLRSEIRSRSIALFRAVGAWAMVLSLSVACGCIVAQRFSSWRWDGHTAYWVAFSILLVCGVWLCWRPPRYLLLPPDSLSPSDAHAYQMGRVASVALGLLLIASTPTAFRAICHYGPPGISFTLEGFKPNDPLPLMVSILHSSVILYLLAGAPGAVRLLARSKKADASAA